MILVVQTVCQLLRMGNVNASQVTHDTSELDIAASIILCHQYSVMFFMNYLYHLWSFICFMWSYLDVIDNCLNDLGQFCLTPQHMKWMYMVWNQCFCAYLCACTISSVHIGIYSHKDSFKRQLKTCLFQQAYLDYYPPPSFFYLFLSHFNYINHWSLL